MAVALNQQSHAGFKPPPHQKLSHDCRLSSLDRDLQLSRNNNSDLKNHPQFQKSLSTPCLLDCLPKSKSIGSGSGSGSTIPNVKSNPSLSTYPKAPKKVSTVVEKLTNSNKSALINKLVAETAVAIALGPDPEPGKGENSHLFYFVTRDKKRFAVVKQVDGESAAREAAAYLLDHEGFAGVPPTTTIKICHPRIGGNQNPVTVSLQRYVPNRSDSSEMGPSMFVTEKVHRIGILDIRLYNIDRHTGNMLVKGQQKTTDILKSFELVPIDHELCLPEKLEIPYFEWLHWPCALKDFSPAKVNYVASLDPFRDAEMVRSELPEITEASVRILILCTIFLKKAVSSGLCLADIGKMMTPVNDMPSGLEILCRRAAGLVFIEKSDEAGRVLDWEDFSPEPEMDRKDVIRSLSKSISFPTKRSAANVSRKMVTFKMLSEAEWTRFLEKFEEILPPAFDARHSIGLEKNQLARSCKF